MTSADTLTPETDLELAYDFEGFILPTPDTRPESTIIIAFAFSL